MVESKAASGKKFQTRKQRRMIFYILMFALPLLQFAIFYLYVNFNSIIIAFQERTKDFEIVFTSNNFKVAFSYFFSAKGGKMLWNSLQLLLSQLLIATPLGLLFSYYIAKEKKGAAFFRVMLYLPQVLSMVVLAALYQFVVNEVYPIVAQTLGFKNADPLLLPLTNTNVQFYTALVFTLWFSFGANVLIYTGAMSGIDQSIVESAQLDGVTTLQEFWFIYVPIIFPTITTFILTSLAGIFNNQMSLHLFFGHDADVPVFAYYFYRMAALNTNASVDPFNIAGQYMTLGQLAALGLIATVILIPVTLLVRKGLQKWGPRVD